MSEKTGLNKMQAHLLINQHRLAAGLAYFEDAGFEEVSGHRLKCALAASLGYRPSRYDVSLILGHDRMATSREEFIAAFERCAETDERNEFRMMWRALDPTDRGFVTQEDFEKLCQEVLDLPRSAVVDAFGEADTSTGRINFQQLEHFFSETTV